MNTAWHRDARGFTAALASHLRRQWKSYRRRLRRCQRKFSEVAVHDSRIEARRLLACLLLLSAFLPGKDWRRARKALKRHLAAVNDLRDTQVQLLGIAPLTRRYAVAADFEACLGKREQREKTRAARKIERLKTTRLKETVEMGLKELRKRDRVLQSFEDVATALAAVEKAFEQARTLRDAIDSTRTETIHATRVAFKAFRYMVEALAEVMPGVPGKALLAMQRYQTWMGEIQDAEVLLAAFDAFVARRRVRTGDSARCRRALVVRRERAIRAYLKRAADLDRFWPLPVCGC